MTPDITEDMVIEWVSKIKHEGVFSTIELLCANQMTIEELRKYVLENQPAESTNTVKDTQ